MKKSKIFDTNIKFSKLPWWKRLLLWFLPARVGYDPGVDNGSFVVIAKKFRGTIYIVDAFEVKK